MSIFSKLFGKKENQQEAVRIGGIEDFMTLIRVYYQATLAVNFGISNVRAFPELITFKHTLKVPTVNNKLGVGERSKCKKMLTDIYGISDGFFKEIDQSIKKNCKTINDVNGYMVAFSGFSQDLMMVIGNLMQWKFRIPSFLHKLLRSMTEKTVHDVLTKQDWNDDSVRKTARNVQRYQKTLGYSENWVKEYAYTIVKLAKKEKQPAQA